MQANYQWLQSVRVLANGTAYGLVHNEFKPAFSGNRSQCSCQSNATHTDPNCSSWFGHRCEMWSTSQVCNILLFPVSPSYPTCNASGRCR